MRTLRHNKQKKIGILIIPMFVILAFFVVASVVKMFVLDKKYQNIKIILNDHSKEKVNPSVKLFIDNVEVFTSEKIASVYDTTVARVKKGKHYFRVSTIDNKYSADDTIDIEGEYFTSNIFITFRKDNLREWKLCNNYLDVISHPVEEYFTIENIDLRRCYVD